MPREIQVNLKQNPSTATLATQYEVVKILFSGCHPNGMYRSTCYTFQHIRVRRDILCIDLINNRKAKNFKSSKILPVSCFLASGYEFVIFSCIRLNFGLLKTSSYLKECSQSQDYNCC